MCSVWHTIGIYTVYSIQCVVCSSIVCSVCFIVCNYATIFFNKLSYFKENILNKKKKNNNNLKNILDDIKCRNNYIFRVIDNNFKELLNYRLVVLDFKTIYDYDTNNFINKEYLNDLSKFCHKNKLLFVIISELNPNNFPNIDLFNKNNLLTPFNYKRSFGSITKLNINKISEKSIKVTINRMLVDIMNQYGVDDKDIILINNTKVINNIKTKLL